MSLSPISLTEAARYMGVKGEPDNTVLELLERAERLVRETVRPVYVYRETAVEAAENGIKLACMAETLTGRDIRKHLNGCDRAVLLAATLSAEADKLIRQTAVRDMAFSLAVDCICSAAVEQLCNKAEEEIFSGGNVPYRTWRFSPGYGDLPLDLQGAFLTALNAQRRIGLTATENSLLIPSKSVTAIIGISDTPVQRGARGCAVCSMRESCAYRQLGGCGSNH
ncbi:MAG: 5-methyltetrahydrofolate--homocysteine methyltransferase [Ruminococcus sp.]|nr:5-methyltetrahydrofolate--homocysteine methyltransferase [Ruminococcus sp.]